MTALRDASARFAGGGENVTLDQGDPFEALGKHAGGKQTGHAAADDDGVFVH